MVCHCSVVLPSSLFDSYALPISLDILSFNQLMNKVIQEELRVSYLFTLPLKCGKVEVSIVKSESRLLTAKKSMTIPRAELNDLLLICGLVPSIVNALKPIYIFNNIYLWTGSSIDFCLVKS